MSSSESKGILYCLLITEVFPICIFFSLIRILFVPVPLRCSFFLTCLFRTGVSLKGNNTLFKCHVSRIRGIVDLKSERGYAFSEGEPLQDWFGSHSPSSYKAPRACLLKYRTKLRLSDALDTTAVNHRVSFGLVLVLEKRIPRLKTSILKTTSSLRCS